MRTENPGWNPDSEPLNPPLTGAELEAPRNIYDMPAHVQADTGLSSADRSCIAQVTRSAAGIDVSADVATPTDRT
ncbi:hypothetical protein [Piscinibacter sp. XHJ-5]|uniref:hypothetical protein n=1 Tax=Piscinibacter sp. XHJ-5 TaxID=3037797 RepID=UPI002452A75D|nr:hypothetical protein [Piscinibacter sp. XHJ-5]